MTPKTKVLKILDKYRDMRLTMGCEVVEEGTFYVANSDEYEQHWFCTPSKVAGGEDEVYYQDDINIDDVKVLGHPAPLASELMERLPFVINTKNKLGYYLKIEKERGGWQVSYKLFSNTYTMTYHKQLEEALALMMIYLEANDLI